MWSTPTTRWSRISPVTLQFSHVRRRRSRRARRNAPARGRFEVLRSLRGAVRVRSGVRRPPGRLPMSGVRPLAATAGLAARAVEPDHRWRLVRSLPPEGTSRVRLRVPGLYNVYNALAAASLSRGLGSHWTRLRTGWRRHRRVRPIRADRVGERTLVVLLVKNPAGANETLRTLMQGDAPALAVIALNDGIADGRDVSWIWDVDFEPLAARLERLVCPATARPSSPSALPTAAWRRSESKSFRRSCRPRPRARAHGARRRPRLPAHVHGHARASARDHRPRLRAALLGARGMTVVLAHLYPDYLNIYADRGNLAVLTGRARRRGIELDVRESAPETPRPPMPTSSTSGAVRIGNRRSSRQISPHAAQRCRCGDGRRRRARRLRRVSAARQVLSRPIGLGAAWRRRVSAAHGGRGQATDRRRASRVRARPGPAAAVAGFENHAGRTILDDGAEPFGRVIAGFGNDGQSGFEGCRLGNASAPISTGHCCREPAARRWLLAGPSTIARSHRSPRSRRLEARAHAVSAARAGSRGGRG